MAAPSDTLQIPDALRAQFRDLERRLWRIDTIIAVSGGICGLLISYVAVFISDRLWDTPFWLRAAAGLASLGAVAWCAWFYGTRWVWGHRTFEAMAALVQKRHRRLGDRLLGIVELADESKRSPNLSPALCAAAIQQVAAEAGRIDFRDAVTTQRSRRWVHLLIVLAAAAAIPAFLAPQASWNAFKRWLLPASHVARYTFVSLAAMPDRLFVAHGEPFEIEVAVEDRSFWHPAAASARVDDQPALDAPIERGKAIFRVPGQTAPATLALTVGDVRRDIAIQPVHRPALDTLTARVDFPAYLQYPPARQKIAGGALTLVEGSRVAFEGKITRALRTATMDGTALPVKSDTFSTAAIDLPAKRDIVFGWTDEYGLAADAPWTLKLHSTPDAPPDVRIGGLAGSVAILEDEVLSFTIDGTDDFGVREMGLRWEIEPASRDVEAKIETQSVARGKPEARALPARFDFSPALLGIPADSRLTLYATAVDYFPDRVPSRSAAYQIYVLSREAHARLIQQQFEKLIARVEELARRQEALLAASEKLHEQPPEKLANRDSEQKLGEQAREQKELAQAMESIAQDAAATLREALRNPSLSKQTLEQWSAHAEAMQALGAKAMPDASQSLDQSSQSQQAEKRAGELAKAVAQQKEILKKMREMQKKTAESLDRLMAENMAMRLRKIAEIERGIAGLYQTILPEVVGLSSDTIDGAPAAAIHEMHAAHARGSSEAHALEGEIERFFDRTRLQRYGDVAGEMDAKIMNDALSQVGALIAANTSVRAIDGTKAWATQFDEWAKQLASGDQTKSPPGKPGDADAAAAEAQRLAMMALMRLRFRESSLRDQTTALDQRRENYPRYGELARRFSETQAGLMKEVRDLQQDPAFSQVVPPTAMEPVHASMDDARTALAKPDTGDPAVNAETDTINIINFLLESKSNGGGSGGGAGSLAMLMRMMSGAGGGAGNSPGGNPNGGTTDQANSAIAGSRTGNPDEARTVEKASGGATDRVPAEFRDALQSYYESLERDGGGK